MRLILALAAVVLLHCISAQEKSWNWENDDASSSQQASDDLSKDYQEAPSEFVETVAQLNDTAVEHVLDEILTSSREGRALNGLDEVYSDPNVQDALQKGDDGEARNIIKERLCFLGLIQCDEQIEGKRPYITPEELVYAQPVAINPVGRPIPTIPVKGVKGTYGPARPVPYPPSHSSIPPGKFGPPPSKFGPPPSKFGPPIYSQNKPPRRHYGPPLSKPFYEKPSLGGEFYEGPDILSKPPFIGGGELLPADIPYKYESGSNEFAHHKDKRVEITVNAQGGAATAAGGSPSTSNAVEHVHHHYHHNLNNGNSKPTVVVNPLPIAAAAVSSDLSTSSFGSTNSFGTNSFKPINSGFNPVSSTGLGSYATSSTSGNAFGSSGLTGGYYGGQTIANYGSSSLGVNSFGSKPILDSYGPQTFDSFGASVGSYGSSGLYKKELNINSVNNNYLQSNYADKYQGLESARAENYDCVCVPYDQCPSHDVIGRKDDLYLPLDPRNLKTDIEAEIDEERVITDGNGTMTVIRVPKQVGLNSTAETQETTTAEKKISKREAPAEKKADSTNQQEARQYGGNYGGSYTDTMKKIKPTFGVSFGLPQQGGGGYPINPYGPNPHVSPYGGAIGSPGINLGLVSVNPLISVQVTKDDHGNKEIKPFINLHVTPNSYLVHKFEDILAYKKGIIFNKHKHYHIHKGHYGHYPHHHEHHPTIYPDHHYGLHHSSPHTHFSDVYPEYDHSSNYHHKPHFSHEHQNYEYDSNDHYNHYPEQTSYYDNPLNYGGGDYDSPFYGRAYFNKTENDYVTGNNLIDQYQDQYNNGLDTYASSLSNNNQDYTDKTFDNSRRGKSLNVLPTSSNPVKFPSSRKRRDVLQEQNTKQFSKRQFYNGFGGRPETCGPRHVCCRKPLRPNVPQVNRQCGTRHSQGINGRIKNPVYVDGDSEFGEYPWQVAILKKDPKESVYVCGGTLVDPLHILTAAHCVKTYTGFDLRVRLGEWDVNHDVEFYPYIERDIVSVHVHPEFYAGTLYNDIAILRMDKPVDWSKHPHISPACLPHPRDDYTGSRCWTTGWGKDAFGDFGKYQNILKEVDVPVMNNGICQRQLQQTRLGYDFKLHPGFVCAGGEEGKDACKGDGGGPMVCERGGTWQVVGIVSWGIGCGQTGVPGVYVKVAHYLDWIRQITQRY